MNKILKKLKKNQGFSLVEMLVVVTIIGVVSAILYSGYSKYVNTAKVTAAKAETLEIVEAFEAQMIENSVAPRTVPLSLTFDSFQTYDELQIMSEEDDLTDIYRQITGVQLDRGATLTFTSQVFTYKSKGVTTKYNIYSRTFELVDFD